jgi:hypothetical protein
VADSFFSLTFLLLMEAVQQKDPRPLALIALQLQNEENQ